MAFRLVGLFLLTLMLVTGCTARDPHHEPEGGDDSLTLPAETSLTAPPTTTSLPRQEETTETTQPLIIESAADLPRDQEGIVSWEGQFDQPFLMMTRNKWVNVRDAPSVEEGNWLAGLTLGQQLFASGVVQGWFRVTILPGLQQGYVRSDLVVEYDPDISFFARLPRQEERLEGGDGTVTILVNELVDLREYAPDIDYHLVFATPDNYIGRPLYSRDTCLLQKGTAIKLAKAQEMVKEDGYRIRVYDAYRPSSVSGILYKKVPDPSFVSPAGKSYHNRGVSVDITLVDGEGHELEMPSQVMELNEKARRNQTMTNEARSNLDYLTGIMKKCGFQSVSNEWWHYTDWDAKKYMVSDIEFSRIEYIAVDAD